MSRIDQSQPSPQSAMEALLHRSDSANPHALLGVDSWRTVHHYSEDREGGGPDSSAVSHYS